MPTNKVSFYLNGKEVTIDNPSPNLLLIDYLRSPGVALAGPKKPCGQGGCGGCTVILSHWNKAEKKAEHRAINSCLRPVCALEGLVVTTVEGTGAVRRPNPAHLHHSPTYSRGGCAPDAPAPPIFADAQGQARDKIHQVLKDVENAAQKKSEWVPKLELACETPDNPTASSHGGMNPVAYRLAINNGSQCGYCSVGFVMNMSEFIVNHPKATKREIEDAFDGNLCRCTGYRSILTGMKTFASDWDEQDEENRMKCEGDAGCKAQRPTDVKIPFPDDAKAPPQPLTVEGKREWHTPLTLEELTRIMETNRRRKLRLVHGNTAYGIYKEEYLETEVLVDIRLIPELNLEPKVEKGDLRVGAGISYSDLIVAMEAALHAWKLGELAGVGPQILWPAGRQAGSSAMPLHLAATPCWC